MNVPKLKTPTVMLQEISQTLADAREHLAELETEIRNLISQGVFDAVPRLDWQTKNGREYLYLWFPRSRSKPGWTGPNGKAKVYVGRDPLKVKNAREWIDRTSRVLELTQTKEQLERWITEVEVEVWRLHRTAVARSYPKAEINTLQHEFSEVAQWRTRH